MTSELTQDEILEGYSKLKNINNLFESDILILPDIKSGEAFRYPLRLDMKKQYENLNIKYYSDDQDKLRYFITDSVQETINIIDLGVVIVSNINSLITIADFLFKRYEGTSIINIQLFNKTVNNNYIYNNYEGDVNNFRNYEIEKMEDNFKHNGP